ncbi:MAG: hypothetical protein ABEJ61_03335 [Haloferacaceae archaeon]
MCPGDVARSRTLSYREWYVAHGSTTIPDARGARVRRADRRLFERRGETETTTTSTATPTPTPTPTATATPTPTPAPTPSVPTHDLGVPFTVGEGTSAIRYAFEAFYRAAELGDSINAETPDGTYLVAVLTLENPQRTATSFPVSNVVARGDGTIRKIDRDGTEAIASDSRIDVPPIGYSSVVAGGSRRGAVAYDLPVEGRYRIEITPSGKRDATPHVVPVGDIGGIEELKRSIVG